MSTLIVGDVHGCAKELELLLQAVRPTELLLVGDLFSKGPDPKGTWELLQEWQARSVLGNHDDYLLKHWEDGPVSPALEQLKEDAPEVRGWLQALPLFLESPDRIVVHAGLHPTAGVPGTFREVALTVRQWPDDSNPHHPFWYDAGWQGPKTVVFGHDARRGLVRREVRGRPVAVGLDTGCVYGGHLTGWIAQEDRLVSIPAARNYLVA